MIREATKYDIPILIGMMRDYSAQSPIAILQDKDAHNPAHVAKMMEMMIVGRGFILLDNEHRGFLAAIVVNNIWCPDVYELRELAWWVNPDHRNGTVGGRLWREFDRRATKMMDDGRVDFVCTSVLSNSPFIDFTKRNYKLLEATFFRG